MKTIKDQLIIISKSLASLSKKVEDIEKQIDKLEKTKLVRKTKKAPAKKVSPAKQVTILDTVFDVVKRTKKGVTVAQLREKTKLDSKQISGALRKLTKKGKIEQKSTGAYKKVGGAGGGRP